MLWFNNNKKSEFNTNDLNVVENDEEGSYLSEKATVGIIKEDLSDLLYIEDDLLLML